MAQYEDVGLRATIEGVSGYTRDAKRIQDETRRIETTMSQTSKGVNQQAQSLVGSLKPIAGAIAAAFAAKLGVDMFKGTVMAASDLYETMNKVDVVFGDAAASVRDFSDNSAQAFGLSRNQALSAAGSFGNLFKNIGLSNKQSAEFSNQLVQNAADLASFNNIDPTDVLDKLRAGLAGEAEPLRILGIDVTETRLEVEALALGITKSTQNMTQAEKVGLRYAAIQKQMGASSGDFARTSDGVANSLRRMNASIAGAQDIIGNKLLPTIQPLISAFASGIPGAVQAALPAIEGFGRAFANVMGGLGKVFEIGKSIREAFNIGGISQAINLVREAITAWVAPAINDITRGLGEMAGRIGTELGKWADQFADWAPGAIKAARDGLSTGAQDLWSWVTANAPTWASKLRDWTAEFATWASGLWEAIKPELGKTLSQLSQWFTDRAGDVRKGLLEWSSQTTVWGEDFRKYMATEGIKNAQAVRQQTREIALGFAEEMGKSGGRARQR